MKILLRNELGKLSIKLSVNHIKRNLLFTRISPLLARLSNDVDFPSSAGSVKQHLELTLHGSLETPNLLARLASLNKSNSAIAIIEIDREFSETEETTSLRNILDRNGSDKGSYHNYDLVYGHLLNQRHGKVENILEIGLGTNNTDTVSNMGVNGIPGASLRAWRDFLPSVNIVGCDIDSRILFEEPRIRTYHLDQTSDSSWGSLISKLKENEFDLIIDDGLHAPVANLRSVIYSLSLLKKDGVLVIEDVAIQSIPIWKAVLPLIAECYSGSIVKTKRAYLVILTRI